MLLDFTFENSYSYKDETYFSMEAAKKTQKKNEFKKIIDHRILKSAIIFGPNASGKSNLMKSLRSFANLVLKDDKKDNPFPTYAKNTLPIKYEITIFSSNHIYHYYVEFKKDEILEEQLSYEDKNQMTTYFHRKQNEYMVIPENLKDLTNKTRKDSLFLNTAKTFNDQHSLNVFRWFRNHLVFISRDIPPFLEGLKKWQSDKKFKANFLNFLQAADINIFDFEVVESTLNIPEEIKNIFKGTDGFTEFQMILKHRELDSEGNEIGEFPLSLDEESDGTKKLISLALVLLFAKNSTILIDEFDDSFHLELSNALIELFNSDENTNQFILTSHELSLMDSGFKKEQIYFTEKKSGCSTELYSIYDFKSEESRADYSYVKRYKKGLFGAVPEILVGKLKHALMKEIK